ncbi:MAG: cation-translocating P-type ATPase [bacterium]|nr:cation-translocating P-type ATPase [bacterium]
MGKILIKSLPPLIALPIALSVNIFGQAGGKYFLIACIFYGLYPLVAQIWRELYKNKRIDLGLPVVLTILLLVYLGELRTAGFFVFLILLGGLFKDYVVRRVRKSVENISEALPGTALLKNADETIEIQISEIKKGQTIALKAGSRVPVDGVLLSGYATLDESVVTGESKHVEKKKGATLIAGSINIGDYAEMLASGTSANSTIAQVKKMVEEAQSKNAPLSRFTTVYAQATVATTLILCAVYYLAAGDILQSIALWIALVPVIFAIIVPVSTTLGISILARHGILIKNAETVENLTKINTVVFDKTGTLTNGRPEVTEILAAPGFSDKDILRIAAGVEKYSEHHLGEALVRKAEKENLEPSPAENSKTAKGMGIEAVSGNKHILLGKREYINGAGIAIDEKFSDIAEKSAESGRSAVFMAVDGRLAGIFFIEDALRENAKNVVAELKRMGFAVIMLTGDGKAAAKKIADSLGIENFRADCLPADKISFLGTLKKEGKKIAMVGDGINDAPALAAADVGIAMGLRGIDLTLQAAGAVLINDDLAVLPRSIRSSRQIFKTIKGDLIIATVMHLITAGLVVSGSIGILGSTLWHQTSSVLVLLNTSALFRLGKK